MERAPSPQHTIDQAVLSCDFPPGARLLLAVSGGADSVALLDSVARLSGGQGWALRLGHVNHGLRGGDSDADEQFVRDLAAAYGVPIEVAHVDVAARATETRSSLEDAARHARYTALKAWLRDWPGTSILTAHTRDDQAETVLLQLFRGAGPIGLGGMRKHGRIVRPLLDVDRAIVRAMIETRGLAFREDTSNRDRRFRRNALRLDVMPAIHALEPSASRSIARAAKYLQGAGDYLIGEAERVLPSLQPYSQTHSLTVSRYVWQVLDPALRQYILRVILERVLGDLRDLEAHHIETIESAVLADRGVLYRLPRNVQLTCNGSRFTLGVGNRCPDAAPDTAVLQVPGTAIWGDWIVRVEHIQSQIGLQHLMAVCGPLHALLDEDSVPDVLEVRARRDGDRIQPVGMTGTRKLQDVMVDRKIPVSSRDSIPVVVADGQVIWLAGGPVDRRYAAGTETGRLLHLCVKPVAGIP